MRRDEQAEIAARELVQPLSRLLTGVGGQRGIQRGAVIEMEFVDLERLAPAVDDFLDQADGFAAQSGHLLGHLEKGLPASEECQRIARLSEEDDKFVHG